jgi:hypothetical protein
MRARRKLVRAPAVPRGGGRGRGEGARRAPPAGGARLGAPARAGNCCTRCAPPGASARAWLQLAWLRRVCRCGSAIAALHLHYGKPRQRCEQRSPRLATRSSNAADRFRFITRYYQLRAAPACSQCELRNRLECGTCCACASTYGHVYALARANAHAWLQLAWLRHAACGTTMQQRTLAALHLPGRRRRCEQRSPRLATRYTNALPADGARYNCSVLPRPPRPQQAGAVSS